MATTNEASSTQGRIDAAQVVVAACQAKALASALQFRDLDFGRLQGVVPANDPGLLQADAEARASRKALDQARVAVRNLQQDMAHEESEMKARAIAAEQWRRQQFVALHRPELATALAEAESEEARLRANPYLHDSASGQQELRVAQHRVGIARRAIEQAANEAPAAEVNHAAG